MKGTDVFVINLLEYAKKDAAIKYVLLFLHCLIEIYFLNVR